MAKKKPKIKLRSGNIAVSMRQYSEIASICKDVARLFDCHNSKDLAIHYLPWAEPVKHTLSRKKDGDFDYETYRFRGYPTKEQAYVLSQWCGSTRYLWNLMVNDYRTSRIIYTPAHYKSMKEHEWLNEVDSYALGNVHLDFDRAVEGAKAGTYGYPRYKKKYESADSYTTNKDSRSDNLWIDGNQLGLPKFAKLYGTIRLDPHREIKATGMLKKCTVIHESDGCWYFALMYQHDTEADEHELPQFVKTFLKDGDLSKIRHIGLDMSLPHMYVDPEGLFPSYVNRGNTISFEKHYNQTEPKLAKAQRVLAHKEHDGDHRSNNYEKQAKKVARIQAKVKHQREDFIRQIAVRLAREYDVISIESLDISAIKRSLKFGKSVSDNGWGMFVEQLERKCAEYGALLIRVDKWFPSTKTCSNCGYIHKEIELKDRTYICPKCGHVMDRDQQAAINIDEEGMRIFCEYFLPEKPPLPPKAWDKMLKSIRIKSAKQLADPSAKVPSYTDDLRKAKMQLEKKQADENASDALKNKA